MSLAIKKISFSSFISGVLALVVALSLFVPFMVSAQEAEVPIGSNIQEQFQQTTLYVTDVVVDKAEYAPGETVRGTFKVHNVNNFDVNNASYQVSLVTEYGEGDIPLFFADAGDAAALPFLKQGSRDRVSFTYELPQTYAGQGFGINVQTILDSGTQLGWGDAKISIVGEPLGTLNYLNGVLTINDEEFDLHTGPTVSVEDVATLDVRFMNVIEGSEELTLTPVITLFDRSKISDPIATEELEPVSFVNGEEVSLNLPLLVDGREPGVYYAELSLVDENGIERASTVSFRYIVRGLIGTIHSLYSDVQKVDAGEVFVVNANITGTPIDVANFDATQNLGGVELVVSVYNALGQKVAEQTVERDVLEDETVAVELTADRASDDLKFSAKLIEKETGRVIDEYEVDIPEYVYQGNILSLDTLLIWVIALILMIIILVMTHRKDKMQQAAPTIVVAFAILIAGGIIGTSHVEGQIGYTDSTSATVSTVYTIAGENADKSVNYQPANIFINGPKPPSVQKYEPGEVFNTQVTFNAARCENRTTYTNAYTQKQNSWWIEPTGSVVNGGTQPVPIGGGKWDDPNKTWWQNTANAVRVLGSSIAGIAGAHTSVLSDYSALGAGNYVAPDTPGTYRFYVYMHNDNRNQYSNSFHAYGARLVYQDFEVVEDQCINVDGYQTEIPDPGDTVYIDGSAIVVPEEGVTVSDTENGRMCDIEITAEPQEGNPLAVGCYADNGAGTVGSAVQWNAIVSGGQPGIVEYSWGGDATGGSSQTPSTYSVSYDSPGTYTATISVTKAGQTVASQCSTTIIQSDLSVSCAGSPGTPEEGETVTWTATPTGASNFQSVTYTWGGVAAGLTGLQVDTDSLSVGLNEATVTATADDDTTAEATCYVTVGGDPTDDPTDDPSDPSSNNPTSGDPTSVDNTDPPDGGPDSSNPPDTTDPTIDFGDGETKES